MHITDRQEKLMDYLYGEMTSEEKLAFETELAADETLRKELQQMQQVRSHLQTLSDIRLSEPVAMPVSAPSKVKTGQPVLRWLKPFYGVAASIAALLLLGAWTGLHVQAGKGQLVLAFGNERDAVQPVQNLDNLTPEVQQYLDQYFQSNAQQVNSLVTTAESKMQEWLNQQQDSWAQTVGNKYLVNRVPPTTNGTYVTMEGLHSLLQKQNKEWEYKLDFFAENFFQYLQATQQQNQQLLRAGLRELAQSVQAQSLQDPRYSDHIQQVNQNYE